jgi:DNA adenine methylase
MTEYLTLVSARLARVAIENKDFQNLISSQDREETLFYLDPPYFETEKYYQNVEFKREDHERLYNSLKNIKGKFILSYNDCPYIRELYKGYNIKEVTRFNNLSFKTKEFRELIITNY